MRLFWHEVRILPYELHEALMQGKWISGVSPDAIGKAFDAGFRVAVVVPGFVFLSRRVWFWEKPWREFRQGFSTEYKRARSTP